MNQDPFAELGLPRQMDLDEQALSSAFLVRSASVHPDRFLDPLDQADAAEKAAALNEAHQVLRDPEARADALVVLLGGPTAEQEKTLPPQLLMEMIEIREELEQAQADQDQPTLTRLANWAQEQKKDHLQAIGAYLDQGAEASSLKAARIELNALRYIERALEALSS